MGYDLNTARGIDLKFENVYGRKFKFFPEELYRNHLNFGQKRDNWNYGSKLISNFINQYKDEYKYFVLFEATERGLTKNINCVMDFYHLFKKCGVDIDRVVLLASDFNFEELYDYEGISEEMRFNIVPVWSLAIELGFGSWGQVDLNKFEENFLKKQDVIPKKLFTCTIGSNRPHREYFYEQLKKIDLDKFGYVSYRDRGIYLDFEETENLSIDITTQTEPDEMIWSIKDFYNDSLFSIQLESDWYDPSQLNQQHFMLSGRLTEKALLPIMFGKPFFILGPKNPLFNIKEFGFKTFSDVFDESYDDEIDMHKRIDMVISEIYRLSKLNQKEIVELKNRMSNIISENFYFLKSIENLSYREIIEKFFEPKFKQLNLI
tara:strand:+ start:75 stop:1202 length:1128 start_codon:yes stop_codon:yes gene_type:complete